MAKPVKRFTVTLLLLSDRADPAGGPVRHLAGPVSRRLVRSSRSTRFASIDDDLAKERFQPPEPGADRVPLAGHPADRAGRTSSSALSTPAAGTSRRSPTLVRAIALRRSWWSRRSLVVQSMRANRFFSAVVRIQTERGHRVIDRGPYGTVRHPGYLGMIVSVLCSGLALGSWLGFALAALYAALILRRVFFEDAFLQANLEGYADYARRVPYRLIPGGW